MFCAIVNLDSRSGRLLQTDLSRLFSSLDPFRVADKQDHYRDEHALIAQTLTFNTTDSLREECPTVCVVTGLVVAAWVRLDNREELISRLSIDAGDIEHATDPQIILHAYRKWGDECVQHLLGDFSFVIYDKLNRSVFAARDAVGVKPFYYCHTEGHLIIASGARVFHAVDRLELMPEAEWIAEYTIGVSMSFTKTPWNGVMKLAPGHALCANSGAVNTRRYFELVDDAPHSTTRCDSYLEQYKSLLEVVVRDRLHSHFPIGSETSGGLDSSTVTGLAAHYRDRTKEDFYTFGHALCEQEPRFILETSRYYGVTHNYIVTAFGSHEDVIESRERALQIYGYPEEHSNGSSHEPFYKLCEQLGVRTLLSGFGGDEVVTNPGHLLYRELIDRHQYWTLFKNIHGNKWLRPLRFFHVLQRDLTRNENSSRITRAYKQRLPHLAIRESSAQRFDLYNRYLQSRTYDAPFRSINQFILGNRWAPFVPTRLDNCTLMAAARRVEYRWPLLDRRLLQQYLSTPSIEKFGGGFGRYLHRRAMVGIVPDSVTWKPGKSMGDRVRAQSASNSGSTNRRFRLNEVLTNELHPALEEVIDSDKLKQQRSDSRHLHPIKHRDQLTTLTRQYTRIIALDSWLKRFHP